MKKIFLLLAILLSVSACLKETRIDASSEEKLQKSIAEIMKELEPDQQKNFSQSLKIIMFGDVENIMDLASIGQNTAIFKGIFQAKVDGKTAQEIVEMANKISFSRENTKPIAERAGVPITADDFLNAQRDGQKRAGNPILADDFLNTKRDE